MNLPHFKKFKEIFDYFQDVKGFINLEAIEDVLKDLCTDPNYKGFKQYHEKQIRIHYNEKKLRKREKKLNHNSIHSDKF